MRQAPLLLQALTLLLLHSGVAQVASLPNSEQSARVTLQRGANASTGSLEIELFPADAWHGDLFVSLYRGGFRERKGVRPDESGDYQLPVRVPEAGEWGIYLRYGVAQTGFAGYGQLRVPEAGGTATTTVGLSSGFSGDVPGYVQPLGFALFGLIAVLALLGLRVLLEQIRRSQATGPVTG